MKVLLLATRSPDGPMTGRKMVLRTIRRSCEALGHTVEVAVVGPASTGTTALPAPGLPRLLLNLLVEAAVRGRSLNECLYWSPAGRRALHERVREAGIDLVIADMARTAPWCVGLPVPWVLDLDDLLSERYRQMAVAGRDDSPLGYFEQRLPRVLRAPAGALARRALAWEAGRMARRELVLAAQADAVTLVSAAEAQRLQSRLQRPVFDAPMAIASPAQPDVPPATADDAVVFLGSLDYTPNREALQHYLHTVAPVLAARGRTVRLDVVGLAPEALRVHADHVRYLGYVDDVAATLRGYRVFVAPIVSGSGIKTKVIEAMACGLAVVATPQAVTGLSIADGQHAAVAASAEAFADAVLRLLDDAPAAQRMGQQARQLAQRHFAPAVLQERWQRILSHAQQSFAARTRAASGPVPHTVREPADALDP